MRQRISDTRRYLLAQEPYDKDKMTSVMKEFTSDTKIQEELIQNFISNQERNQRPDIKRKRKAIPKLADCKRFSFQNIHEIIKKKPTKRATSQDPTRIQLKNINTITYTKESSAEHAHKDQRASILTPQMEEGMNILQALGNSLCNLRSKSVMISVKELNGPDKPNPHPKALKIVKIESKKSKKNIVEITKRLTDLADMLDAKSNSDSNVSITSKRRKKKKKAKKSKRQNSDCDKIAEEDLHRPNFQKKPTCKSNEDTLDPPIKKCKSLRSSHKQKNDCSGLKLSLNKCPSFTEISQNAQCKSNHSNDKQMFAQPPQKLGIAKSFLKAYSLKKGSYFGKLEDSELLSTGVQKSCKSLKRKKIKKQRKRTKLFSSRGMQDSESDSFKFSLFKASQMNEMLHSLSNLESNASNYSTTTLSPSPPKRMKD
ncbi:unnamed protein product [Moneuplotes crassus]|uniref:Uncharacterized protein n=1 Tax=Euplotes crassus TaxID=5936 RepID=A0AAD1U2E4_EUPCR|nr:unnamed protein product [Moneuplotes crassus]